MHFPVNRLGILCLVLPLITCFGCGEPNIQQPTYSVTGDVQLDGKPLDGATIVLHAVDPTSFKWSELPQGLSDSAGKFTLFTYSSNDGAPAGEYKVGIAVLQAASDDGGDQSAKGPAKSLPAKYADPEKSGIRVKVEKKATAIPTINLLSK